MNTSGSKWWKPSVSNMNVWTEEDERLYQEQIQNAKERRRLMLLEAAPWPMDDQIRAHALGVRL